MSTIRDKLYFNFNGESSANYNIVHVNLDNGLFEEGFIASREIVEKTTIGNDNPIFNRLDYSPLEFELKLAFDKPYNDRIIDDIVRWLFVDYYKPLYFYGNEGKILYCMPVGEPLITHNGLNEGYLTVPMRSKSPFYYSPIIVSEVYDLSSSGSKSIVLTNNGHFDIYPEISITATTVGNVEIISKSNGGKIFQVRDLANTEGIYINTKREIIESDFIGVNKYDKVVGEYPYMIYGDNTFEINGRCLISFRYQNIYKY